MALCALLALGTACDTGSVRLLLRYPDQAAYDRARSVELWLTSNASCAEPTSDRGTPQHVFDAHGPGPTPQPAAAGQHAIRVTVRDAACLSFLDRCLEVELGSARDQTVVIALQPVNPSGCSPAQRCASGRCTASDVDAAVADAAANDADGPRPDAARDGSTSDGPVDATRPDTTRVVVLQDDTGQDFQLGSAQQIINDGGTLLLAEGYTSGIFESRWLSYDGGSGALTAFEWLPAAPYSKQLPDRTRTAAEVAAYEADGLSLDRLVLLLHFSGETGTFLAPGSQTAETSGGDHPVVFLDNDPILSSTLVDGKLGTAAFISRDDCFVVQDADSSTEFHFDDGAFSYAVWVKIASCAASASTSIVAIGGEIPHIWLGASCPEGTAYWMVRDDDGTGDRVRSTVNVIDDQWHHLVGVKEPSPERIALYVDGVAVSHTTGHWAHFGNPTKKILLGNFPAGTPPLYNYGSELSVDELAIFARALSAGEVRALYARGAAVARFQLWLCDAQREQCDLEQPLWIGPDGTTASAFDELANLAPQRPGPLAPAVELGGRYFKYRLLLGRDDLTLDPRIHAVRLHLTVTSP